MYFVEILSISLDWSHNYPFNRFPDSNYPIFFEDLCFTADFECIDLDTF